MPLSGCVVLGLSVPGAVVTNPKIEPNMGVRQRTLTFAAGQGLRVR